MIHLRELEDTTFCGRKIADLAQTDPHGGMVTMISSVTCSSGSAETIMWDNMAKRADCHECLAVHFSRPRSTKPDIETGTLGYGNVSIVRVPP